ncbi:hypothetical protein [Gimibacter soli]|uniref:Uncharacterized protein n=1 Tax=Gimibacter soli TaxID=3024400 RepID=A0AAF0BKM4_9PROT|nr:hypothetical protein [Gimibacter soli]WCL54449.1 hypothetical protein PH603_01585 [Gimibacter soli]
MKSAAIAAFATILIQHAVSAQQDAQVEVRQATADELDLVLGQTFGGSAAGFHAVESNVKEFRDQKLIELVVKANPYRSSKIACRMKESRIYFNKQGQITKIDKIDYTRISLSEIDDCSVKTNWFYIDGGISDQEVKYTIDEFIKVVGKMDKREFCDALLDKDQKSFVGNLCDFNWEQFKDVDSSQIFGVHWAKPKSDNSSCRGIEISAGVPNSYWTIYIEPCGSEQAPFSNFRVHVHIV